MPDDLPDTLPEALWSQFGAALQTLENTIRACPVAVWDSPAAAHYWYIAFHTLFWTDYYLSETPDEADFRSPAPFSTSDFDEPSRLPERVYTQAEVLDYLTFVRARARTFIASLDAQKRWQRCGIPGRDYSYFELTLYNLRHVQHHAAQLNLLLRQRTDTATDWVSRARQGLRD